MAPCVLGARAPIMGSEGLQMGARRPSRLLKPHSKRTCNESYSTFVGLPIGARRPMTAQDKAHEFPEDRPAICAKCGGAGRLVSVVPSASDKCEIWCYECTQCGATIEHIKVRVK